MGAIERLNETWISAELFKALLAVLGDPPPGDRRDEAARGAAMLSHFKANKIDGDHVLLLTAVRFRMCALSRLRDQPAFAAWSRKAAKVGKPDLLHETLVETAAVHPLVDLDNEPSFEPEGFFRTALERSAAQGRA